MTINLHEAAEAALELKRRSKHSLYAHVPGDTPGWNQKSFHESTAIYRLLFGGNQSGKSRSAAYEIVCWLRGKHPYRVVPSPPNRVWAISAEYTTLEAGIYRHLLGDINHMIPDWEIKTIGPKIPQQNLPGFIELKNGSKVVFKSAKGDSRQKFQAAAVDLISIDEEVFGDIWTELQARTMDTGGEFIISATLIESYEWIVELEERAEAGEKDYFLVRLDSRQNTYLNEDRVRHLEASWSEEEKEVRLKGMSRRSTGLIYNTFKRDKHIVKPFKIPWNWPKWNALDPGIRVFGGLWIAISPNNKAYVYREMYERGKALYEIAYIIKTLEHWKLNRSYTKMFSHYVWDEQDDAEHMILRIIDDKVGARLITGDDGVMEQLSTRYAITTIPADKVIRPGIEDCRQWLDDGFYVFDTCTNFINEITKYRISSKKPRKDGNDPVDKPLDKLNHLMDCWRYIARERPKYTDIDRLPDIYPNTMVIDPNRHRNPFRKRSQAEEYEHETLGTNF